MSWEDLERTLCWMVFWSVFQKDSLLAGTIASEYMSRWGL